MCYKTTGSQEADEIILTYEKLFWTRGKIRLKSKVLYKFFPASAMDVDEKLLTDI